MSWAPVEPSVLLVEDDPLFVRMIDRQSRRAGLEVEFVNAATVSEAERVIDGRQFDLVLIDERLPDGSGSSLAGRITGLPAAPPVIVVTGGDDRMLWHRAAAAEVVAMVPKDIVSSGRIAEILEFGYSAGAESRVARLSADAAGLLSSGVAEGIDDVLARLVAELGLASVEAVVQRTGEPGLVWSASSAAVDGTGSHEIDRSWHDLEIRLRFVASTRRWNRVDAMLRVLCDVILRQVELDRRAAIA